ncbi:FAD-binding oxidoreductase [Polycladidibacter hongkongensis]|uniref:FAD-binding oxidoreductase n=1 Tax=Polycladidibacter hongkongensis TaxID=1647556 RepID=UPI00082EF963|nr:FAD-binding oxidoreductase [Pseudovibrio hongkongensis]
MTTPIHISEFRRAIGPAHVLIEDADKQGYLVEWRDKFQGTTEVVLRPGSPQEVAKCVKIAARHGLKVVPQAGNTGLVGGQIPREDRREIVISVNRLNKIRHVDSKGYTISVDGGVKLQQLQEAAEEADRLFPLALASQGSCIISGNIATNAGGTAVLSYGNTRDLVLGLEVVMANGEIWHGMRALRKDNTGYDLKQLFIGSEGTLGIITGACLKLLPRPCAQNVALCGVDSPEQALSLFAIAKKHAGPMLTAFEIMPRLGMRFSVKHQDGLSRPLAQEHNWYVVLELSAGSPSVDLEALTEAMFGEAFEAEALEDAVLAQNGKQAADIWRLRHGMSEVQKFEGGSIKHDISVSVNKVPAFLREALAAVEALVPGCRPVPFGHMGDGNLHFNITQPEGADKQAFLARWDEVNEVVHAIVARYDGSISAEHGIGVLKRDLMAAVKSPVELEMMRAVKRALDPDNLFNPDRILRADRL